MRPAASAGAAAPALPERPGGRRAQILVVAGCVAFLALVWAAILFHLDDRQRAATSQAERDVSNLSVALGEQVTRLVEHADQLLRLIQEDFRDDPAFDFAAWARRSNALGGAAREVGLIDPEGRLTAARTPRPADGWSVSVADRPYFKALSTQPEAGLYVERTVRGRSYGGWAFILARRLGRADGSFGGIVVVALDPDHLARHFQDLDVGRGGSVALYGLDGFVRVRSPDVPGMYEHAEHATPADDPVARLPPGPGGRLVARSPVDGVVRIVGFRRLEGLPLVVMVGKSRDEVLAPVRDERVQVLAAGGGLSAGVLAGCLALLRELERRRRSHGQLVAANRALADAETLFRGVFENATDNLFVHRVAPDGSFALEAFNPAASRLVGLDGGAAWGRVPEDFAPPEIAARMREDIEAVIRTGQPVRRQHGRERADGPHTFEVILVPLAEPGATRIGRVFASARDITHLRRAEERMAASEARYRLLADHAGDMIVQLDLDGSRLFVSPASRTLLGYDPEEILGTRPQDDVHPDDAPRLAALMARLARGEAETGASTHRLRRKDGSYVRVEGAWRLVRDAAGRPSGFVASVRDVEARQIVEDALRASEARYRALADALPQLVWVTRAQDGEAVYVNRQFEAYYGPIGTARAARVAANHPDDAPAMARAWEEAVRFGRGYEIDTRLRRQDGAYRWHKLIMVPMRQGGAIEGWVGSALDIDDILSARRALEETGDLLSLAQDAAEAGAWDIDLESRTVRLSPASAQMHGLAQGSAHGLADRRGGTVPLQAWHDRIAPADRERALREVQEAIVARRTLATEFRILTPGGERWVQSIGRAYYDAAGQPVRVIGLNLDISERKNAEAALREANAAAEAARLEAERASLAKSDFLAAMSHEIRTPLNGVIGFVDLLAQAPALAPDLRRHAEMARTAGAALRTVVDDILDFSKVEAGAVELEVRPFSPRALAEAALSIVRDLAERKGLDLRARIDPALPGWLSGDEDRLRQILLNLLNNAAKFTPRGTITLAAAYEGAGAAGEQVRFSVTDTGIGIPADKQHRLFERFSQVDSSIKRDFGGTGLGLAICRRLVTQMGGTIGVSSQDGAGATFWIALCLPRAAPPVPPPRRAPGARRGAPAGSSSSRTWRSTRNWPASSWRRSATRWTW